MDVIRLYGDHFQMGIQHATQVLSLRPLIMDLIQTRLAPLHQAGLAVEQKVKEFRVAIESQDRCLVQMMEGMSEALSINFDLLFKHASYSYLQTFLISGLSDQLLSTECTTWAASGAATSTGQPVLVKSRDFFPEHLPLQLVALARPEVGYRYGYITSAAVPGVFSSGLNEVGLAVADARVFSTDIGPGLPSFSLMMHILEGYASVRSAIEYLLGAPRMGGCNIILADADGDMCVFESGHSTWGLVEAENETIVSTNHFVSPQMFLLWVERERPHLQGNSLMRFERVKSALEEDNSRIDPAWAQSLMAHHGGHLDALCRHQELDGRFSTISTTIYLPAERGFWTCFGYPCQEAYHYFSVREGWI